MGDSFCLRSQANEFSRMPLLLLLLPASYLANAPAARPGLAWPFLAPARVSVRRAGAHLGDARANILMVALDLRALFERVARSINIACVSYRRRRAVSWKRRKAPNAAAAAQGQAAAAAADDDEAQKLLLSFIAGASSSTPLMIVQRGPNISANGRPPTHTHTHTFTLTHTGHSASALVPAPRPLAADYRGERRISNNRDRRSRGAPLTN